MHRSTSLTLLVTILALVVVIGASLWPSIATGDMFGPDQAVAAPPSYPFTDVSPYGANFFLEWEPEEWKVEKTLEMAHDAGIHWVKEQFPWESLQLSPGPNGYWNPQLNASTWDKYDKIVDLANKYDLELIVRLDRPPAWTRTDNSRPEAPPDNYALYGDFVYQVVKHFQGRVHYYQIWNEPNIYPEWGGNPPDPEAYTRLLQIAYTRAKEADPNVVILSAPLAQTTEDSNRNEDDVKYLQGMYEAGAGKYFDILFANAYGFGAPPSASPSSSTLNFRRVELLRAVMERNGDGSKPVWFNEFGWDAPPAGFSGPLPWSGVAEDAQAQYTVQAIQYARQHWPWAGVFNVWYFRQPGNIPETQADYYFRMVDVGFTPRPLYNAIKDVPKPTSVGPGSYAMSDPSVSYAGSWGLQLNKAAVGGAMRSSITPGDSVKITFEGSGLDLRVEHSANAGQVYVTVDGREANLIAERAQGRSVLNLSGSGQDGIVDVPVAAGLGPGQHVMRLVVGQSSGPAHGSVLLAGFSVKPADRLAPLWLAGRRAAIVLAIGLIVLVITLVWPRRRAR
ncbi:MAG TPA: hypothetical protein VFZ25_16210 [Chloroflexota bacterium]|nr:hypothetical protein [Chloroflexota bacterium]